MERKRTLVNAAFAFFPVLLALMYYLILLVGDVKNLPQPSDFGTKFLGILLQMPQTAGISVAMAIKAAALLLCLFVISHSAINYQKSRGKIREEHIALLARASFAFVGILVLPYVFEVMFAILQVFEAAMVSSVQPLLAALNAETLFIVLLTALTFLRYIVMYLALILFPVFIILCIYDKVRFLGKIFFEQAFTWIFASDVALVLLMIINKVEGSSRPLTHIPLPYVAIPSEVAVIIAPPITIILLFLIEKTLITLLSAAKEEFKQT